MKNYRTFLLVCLLGFSAFTSQAQGLLGIGTSGISGFPATSQFGDTVQNLGLWVVNTGITPVGNLNIAFLSQTNSTGTPFQIGSLDLTGGIIPAGDSLYVPLDYFIVTPQNSNQGSNVMVIWPTSPGTTPSDSAETDYEVDGATAVTNPLNDLSDQVQLWPNPTRGAVNLHIDKIKLQGSRLQVFNAMGKLVTDAQLQYDQVIDLSQSAPGIYTVKVITPGGIVIPHKIIKQ